MATGFPRHLEEVDSEAPLLIDKNKIMFQSNVKYLGVTIDKTLSMHDQISSICRASFLELRRIASIRKYLSTKATARLVQAMVISRLDYCNSILTGLPKDELKRLQRIQNNAARLVYKKKKRDHITPLLRELHWLPVEFRCQFKICTFAYRCFDGFLPSYLSDALTIYKPSRSLRSACEKLLVVTPPFNLKTVGERSFSYLAPILWNSLPVSLRQAEDLGSFERGLKTHFFAQAF